MVLSPKTKSVMSISLLIIIIILTISAKRKTVVDMGKGKDMTKVSMTTQIPDYNIKVSTFSEVIHVAQNCA